MKSRREFLANLFSGVGIFLGLGGLLAKFVQFLYPVVPPERIINVVVAKRSQVPTNGSLTVHNEQGHIILLDIDGSLRAFSAVCTHLGCLVKWEAEKKRFHCPCHHGMYAADGRVMSGPPPRPLAEYPVTVSDGNVVVGIKVRPKMV